MLAVSKEHITKTPGVCGGKACIAGTRIRVMDLVVRHEHRGESPDEITDQLPGITIADVYAALAYYHDNRSAIEAEFRTQQDVEDRYRSAFPSKVRAKLDG